MRTGFWPWDYGLEELNFIAAFVYEDAQFQHGLYIAQHILEGSEGIPGCL